MQTKDPHQKNTRRWGVLLALIAGGLALVLTCIFAFVLIRARRPVQIVQAKPLVIIHHPLHHDQIETGTILPVHATARSSQGISRLELWANGTLIAQKDNPSAETNLTIVQAWTPYIPGGHVLIARAFSPDGSHGQSTIRIHVSETAALYPDHHLVQEGEIFDDIANLYGLDPDDLAELNPGLSPRDLAPGDELTLPEDDEPPTDPIAPEIPDAGEPPLPDDDPPTEDGSLPRLGDILEAVDDGLSLFPPLDEIFPGLGGEPTGLQIELLGLETGAAYDGLFCYLGAAGNPPNRYPDGSEDLDLDATFQLDETAEGETALWRVDGALAPENQTIVFWQRNRALPLELACVGISGGGTVSLDLGRWEGTIRTDRWSGMLIQVEGNGGDGWFIATLRVNRVGHRGPALPNYLDTNMTPPINARINHDRESLEWDYFPMPGEEIDGFRIYLNGGLQWVEPASARESFLPREWLHPPCFSTYNFNVTAFRYGYPDGPESLPAITLLRGPTDRCHREIEISFLSLQTFNLGYDGARPPHSGDVGPVYGYFYANDQRVSFDTRAQGRGGRLDSPNGLDHHTFYDLGEMAADPTWRFDGIPTLIVEIPTDGHLEFGFEIMDQDQGRCRQPSDPGCDDLICDFQVAVSVSDHHQEGTLGSFNRRCHVAYRFGPAFGSPVGTGVPGWEPLPSIIVEDVLIDDTSGAVSIEVRNIGAAAWPRRDLTVELQSRLGESLGVFTWSNFDLGVGQRTALTQAGMALTETPYDACVLIDPFDDVLEDHESVASWIRQPYCPQMPDLVIESVHYQADSGGQLHIRVHNRGQGGLRERTLEIGVLQPDGSPLGLAAALPGVSLAPRETGLFILDGVSEAHLELMRSGYQVVINPGQTINESNFENNTFEVAAAERLYVRFWLVRTPYAMQELVSYDINVNAISGSEARPIARWQMNRVIPWVTCDGRGGREFCSIIRDNDEDFMNTGWFELMGDESLEISANVRHYRRSQYDSALRDVFNANTLWGSGPTSVWGGACGMGQRLLREQPGGHHWRWSFRDVFGEWAIRFVICQDDQ